METVPFHGKIIIPFLNNYKINVVTFENKTKTEKEKPSPLIHYIQ